MGDSGAALDLLRQRLGDGPVDAIVQAITVEGSPLDDRLRLLFGDELFDALADLPWDTRGERLLDLVAGFVTIVQVAAPDDPAPPELTDGERHLVRFLFLSSGQGDSDTVTIPRHLADWIATAFARVLNGDDPREALQIKPGRKRTDLPRWWRQFSAAFEIRKAVLSGLSVEYAAGKAAQSLSDSGHEVDPRTLRTWYRKFYPTDSEK